MSKLSLKRQSVGFSGFIRWCAFAWGLLWLSGSAQAQYPRYVSTVSSNDGRQEVFVADHQKGVLHAWQTDTDHYDTWTPAWTTYLPKPDLTPGAVVSIRDGRGRVMVAWVSGGAIWFAGAPSPGAALAAPLRITSPQGLHSLVASVQGGIVYLFALDSSGAAVAVSSSQPPQAGNPGWFFGESPKKLAPETSLMGHDLRSISVAPYFTTQQIGLVAAGGDGHVYWMSQQIFSLFFTVASWTPWSSLGDANAVAVWAHTSATSPDAPIARFEMIAIESGTQGSAVRHNNELSTPVPSSTFPRHWNGWETMGFAPLPPGSDLAFAADQNTRLEVFASSGANGDVSRIWQPHPNNDFTNQPVEIGGAPPWGAIAGSANVNTIAVALDTNGRLVLASANSSGGVAVIRQVEPNSDNWTTWFKLP
jgi:hypothetical protein